MPIDPKAVQWDEATKIDPASVKWDAPKQSGILDARGPAGTLEDWKNLALGGVRGAARIGSTLLASPAELRARFGGAEDPRASGVVGGLVGLGADPESLPFKAGDIGAQIVGTMGVGGGLAQGVRALAPAVAAKAAPVLSAIESAGMKAGGLSGASALAARSAGGAITGGASAGLVDPKNAKTGAMIGGAMPAAMWAGGVGGKTVGAGARAAFGKVSDEVASLAKRAEELGIKVPADRLVNSRPLNAVAASLNYVPLSGRAATEEAMRKQMDRALSRTFGQNSDNVTSALRRASAELGDKFDDFLKNNTVSVTPAFRAKLAEIENQATAELGSEAAGVIHRQIAAIQTKGAAGAIDGAAAYNIKKALDRIGGGNREAAHYARELKRSLIDALNESVGPEKAASFAKLRQQYGNMLDVEKIATNGAEGGVSVARLAGMKNIGNKDLQELADIASQFLVTRESPHGAMQRLAIGGTAAAMSGTGGLPYLAATMAAGRGANAMLNSGAARNALMGSQGAAPSLLANELQRYLLTATPVVGASR